MHIGGDLLGSEGRGMNQTVLTQAVINTLATVMVTSVVLTGLVSGLMASGVLGEKKKKKPATWAGMR